LGKGLELRHPAHRFNVGTQSHAGRLETVLAPRRSGEYVQGGGWVCVEEHSGRLVVINLDQRDAITLFHSSVSDFYSILAHLLAWSEKTDGSRNDLIRLRDGLRRQTVIPQDDLESYWLNAIDATLDEESRRFGVALK
jgi:hypothetical protein